MLAIYTKSGLSSTYRNGSFSGERAEGDVPFNDLLRSATQTGLNRNPHANGKKMNTLYYIIILLFLLISLELFISKKTELIDRWLNI